jgi:hypothetical protein
MSRGFQTGRCSFFPFFRLFDDYPQKVQYYWHIVVAQICICTPIAPQSLPSFHPSELCPFLLKTRHDGPQNRWNWTIWDRAVSIFRHFWTRLPFPDSGWIAPCRTSWGADSLTEIAESKIYITHNSLTINQLNYHTYYRMCAGIYRNFHISLFFLGSHISPEGPDLGPSDARHCQRYW